MIPEFDKDGLAVVPLSNGRAISLNNEKRTKYLKRQMGFMYDPPTMSTAASATSYEVAFLIDPDGGSDRDFIPPGWEVWQDDVRSDPEWRIFGHVPKDVVHDYLDENGVPS